MPRLTKAEWQIISMTLIVIILGYSIAYFTKEPNTFARSGAVIVCVGIFFGFKNYPHIAEEFRSFVHKNPPSGFKEEVSNKVLSDIDQIIDRMKYRFLQIESAILIFGTLIWGFGDLLIFV
ncbi:hypothetical protein ACU5EH_25195 [Aliivibrio salmonicida]|uniref:hypothetical protein n=1 Tax=Aliivibrio salmonicida TaxID=40269 RepID=UPI00406C0DA8